MGIGKAGIRWLSLILMGRGFHTRAQEVYLHGRTSTPPRPSLRSQPVKMMVFFVARSRQL